jgi:uncharacterized membrane protein
MSRLIAPRVLWRAMLVINVLAIVLTVYLTYIHYQGISPVCSLGQACAKVQSSTWSKLAGVPVALIGLLGYISILGSLLLLPDREETRLATLGMTLMGFGFSAYLTYRELFSIHLICEECVTSFVFVTLLLIGSGIRYVQGPPTRVPPGEPEPDPELDAEDEPSARVTAAR